MKCRFGAPKKFNACKRYIEENPLRAGLVNSAAEYALSSAGFGAEVDPMPDHFRYEVPAAKAGKI